MEENKFKKKLKDIYFKYSGSIRKRKIKNTNFSIISNNCWGGVIYRNFHIPYQSPTCGIFFIAPEYIKFIYNIKEIVNQEIKEITIEESKYSDYLLKKNYSGLLGKIGDVEICFLHYKDFNEAREKWKRRAERINWNRIIFKFNDQNLCTEKELQEFYNFKARNKICFTAQQYDQYNTIQLKQFEKDPFVISDTREKDYKKVLDIVRYINSI